MPSLASSARVSRAFLVTAVVLGFSGMVLGLTMGIMEDHRLRPVHTHVNLIGFVALFMAGLFYRQFPLAASRMAWAHYGLTLGGVALMALGLVGVFMPVPALAPLIVPGSLMVLAGMILFIWIVVRATGGDAADSRPSA